MHDHDEGRVDDGASQVAEAARRHFALEHVIFVPAARPPHKLERRLAGGEERCRMLELVIGETADASIWSVELAREGPSYTLDTVRVLQAAIAPETEVFLILGADNLTGFTGWYGIDELLERVQPIVCVRRGWDADPNELSRLPPEARARLEAGRLEVEPFEASSSAIRAALARGARTSVPGLGQDLLEYIRARGIY